MAILRSTFQDLYNAVLRKYYGDIDTYTTGQTTTAKRIVNDGYQMFLAAHKWKFLDIRSSITLWVTGDESPAADAVAMDSDDNSFLLPEDFGEMKVRFTRASTSGDGAPLSEVQLATIQALNASTVQSGRLQFYAIYPADESGDQRWRVTFWPTPTENTQLVYGYRQQPVTLSANDDLPVGGPMHAATIKAAALAECEGEKSNETVNGRNFQKYMALLAKSVEADNRLGPVNLGQIYDAASGKAPLWERGGDVSYTIGE